MNNAPKLGRPAKPAAALRSERIMLSLTAEERAIIASAAVAGGEQESVWAREVVLRAAKRAGR